MSASTGCMDIDRHNHNCDRGGSVLSKLRGVTPGLPSEMKAVDLERGVVPKNL